MGICCSFAKRQSNSQTSPSVKTIIAPHYSKISIHRPEDYLYMHSKVLDMLVLEYPISISISADVVEYVDKGLNTIKLQIPVNAKFLIKGECQAQFSSLIISKLHVFIHFTDLKTDDVQILKADANIIWIRD